ncbi:MAG: C25 family cysteine peptidase [Lacibacter sp.]
MKRLPIIAILFICSFASAQTQTYMNEWIDYSKTYHKFSIAATGVYRISQAQLTTLGIAGADASHFQLWRNGQQVPIYTSSPAGSLPSNGYIEFWGETNDGKWEKRMYLNPDYQINDKWSIFTDTAAYFLTVNTTASANSRLVQTNNNLATPQLPEPYFIYTAGNYYKNNLNYGYASNVGSNVYSSSFDRGEGYTSSEFAPSATLTTTLSNLYVAPTGPNALLKFSGEGRATNARTVRVSVNNTQVTEVEMNYFNSVIDASANNIPLSLLSSNSAAVSFKNTSTETSDRIVIGMFELTYPRLFNFGGQSDFQFELPANSNETNLVIDNANFGSQPPVLYDLTNGLRITASVVSPTQIRVVLPPSASARKLVLVSEDASNVKSVSSFKTRTFTNYGLAANQGDYIIISNPLLYSDANGVNQVEQYRLYRSSSVGGGFNAKIYNIQDIIDQFGYGIKNNAYAIKNFLRFSNAAFATKPKYSLIIGKGVIYNSYRSSESNPTVEKLNLVPVLGNPASDMSMAAEERSIVPFFPIGRLNVVDPAEVKAYLDKVKQYESYYNTNSCNMEDELWKKNVIHIGGANDYVGEQIMYYLNQYAAVIKDTLCGATVYSLQKTGVAVVQNIASENISRLFREGFSLLTYFGHSSPTTLEYNLSDPANYPAIGKYPIFVVNGCQAGNLFLYDATRLTGNKIISEKWVLNPQMGSIAFVASTHLGIVHYLNLYTEEFYNQVARVEYGKSLGEIMKNVCDSLIKRYSFDDYYVRMHLEQITLHGDPAIKFYSTQKPDYGINEAMVKVSPEFISIAEDKFNLSVSVLNAGRSVEDSLKIRITREIPDGSKKMIFEKKIAPVSYKDSIVMEVPINAFTDKGLNKIKVELDPDNTASELCETNNTVTKEFFIFEDEVRPVYPYNFSIVNKKDITFYASTANPIGSSRKFYFEIDTTAKFNSPIKKVDSLSSSAGSISFKPSGLAFNDSIVYYWRVGVKPAETTEIVWNNFSFVYIPGVESGFNQSHYYQHKQSTYTQILLDSTSRKFIYDSTIAKIQIRTGVYPYHTGSDIDIAYNLVNLERYNCKYFTFQFYVFNSKTLQPWKNTTLPNGEGKYRSAAPNCNGADNIRLFFEFYYNDQTYRKRAMDFMDSIQTGDYVFVTNQGANVAGYPLIDANILKSDTSAFGSGNSLYHKFKSVGFNLIDSFKSTKPMLFIYRKDDNGFVPVQQVGDFTDWLISVVEIPSYYDNGKIESPWFGPAKNWKQLIWQGKDNEVASPDVTSVDIIGKTSDGVIMPLATITNARDTLLDFISASGFPYIKLSMNNTDHANITPHQLSYWRILGSYLPEGAIAPNLAFRMKDTVDVGEQIDFAVAFRNVSENAFDSLKLKLVITDRNNVPHTYLPPKKRPLVAGDSIVVSYTIDTKDLPGANTLYLMVNPDNDQPEQILFNNFLYKGFYVKPDNYNPWLDVTFDGTHILNRDIVSSKPHIVVKLKDESKYLALSDTAGMKISIRFPDNVTREYKPQSDSVRFTPANLASGENAATIDITPFFTQDGEYELTVSGTDYSGNKAGNLDYKVAFEVINKPMISNLLNYPNPFTTSTAFVFTLTGSEVPQNMRIQILTITGKVVREITKSELGPLHIGRNITEYKWDGTDQFGNKLANGIYLYRVITNNNGAALDKYKAEGDNTDQYFNKGYGKMYLMR